MNNKVISFSGINSNNKIQTDLNQSDNYSGRKKYINNSNVINEKSSDNDMDNSDTEKEKDFSQLTKDYKMPDKGLRRFTIEYIKVLGLYMKGKKDKALEPKEIMNEFNIPKELIEGKKVEKIFYGDNSDIDSIKDTEEKIDFDNDIQPPPSLNHEMKIVIYLSKPKIIVFNGNLSLFYISPVPVDKNAGYNIVVKNTKDKNDIFKIKIMELISCKRKNEKTIFIQNFGTKILSKTKNEMTFKNEEECSLVHQGITFLMNNKEEDIFY